MAGRNSNNGCGNTIRSQETATTQVDAAIEPNSNIEVATGDGIDYSNGQPLYEGSSQCDPARNGSDQITCCK